MNAAIANEAILALRDTLAVHRPNNDTVCGLVRTGVWVVRGPEPLSPWLGYAALTSGSGTNRWGELG